MAEPVSRDLLALLGDWEGFEVAQLTHEDDVGILAQCSPQRVLERLGVPPTCRCVMRHLLLWCTNSMGSSIVMM
jgi:hypothetical protein